MIKKIISVAATLLACTSAFAGGYLINTNQNIAFVRMPAQNAVVGTTGAYFNPAGTGFMEQGWHASFGSQTVKQSRTIKSSYAPLALNEDNLGDPNKKYKGETFAPVIPSIDIVYVANEHWFGSFHFGVIAGGGKCKYDEGIGSFDGLIAMVPTAFNALAQGMGYPAPFNSYGVNLKITGSQYFFGGQLSLGYRLNEHLSFSLGVRTVYAMLGFDATIADITINGAPAMQSISAALGQMGIDLGDNAAALGTLLGDRTLDCTQTGWGVAPLIGVHYRLGGLDLAARYEFNTSIRLKNDTVDDAGLAQYKDGKDGIANDVSAMLSLGAGYTLSNWHFNLGFNYYFDKQSKVYYSVTDKNDKTDGIDKNPYEILGGISYDYKKWTFSGGMQFTHFSWGEEKVFENDMGFNPSSTSYGLGLRYNFNSRISIDAGVFNTFYHHLKKEHSDFNTIGAQMANSISGVADALPASMKEQLINILTQPGSDNYHRTSFDVGVGININF